MNGTLPLDATSTIVHMDPVNAAVKNGVPLSRLHALHACSAMM